MGSGDAKPDGRDRTPPTTAAPAGWLAAAWPSGIDALLLGVLLVVVGWAWCDGHGIRTEADWSQPLAYIEDPEKSDVISTYAGLKAAAAGQMPPLFWKHVPELGAPFGSNWSDWPMIEELQLAFFGLLAKVFGLFMGLNVGMLSGHLLAAATCYAVARAGGCLPNWSFVAGLAYGLAPFFFAQSPHHLQVQWAWHVPLFALVWRWVATAPGLEWGSGRFRWAIGISVLTGLMFVYYTNVFCQLVLIGALVLYAQSRGRPALQAACAVIGAAAAAVILMSLDTWTFGWAHGPNRGALVREYKWLEIYGLKLVDLVIPPVTHRSAFVAAWARGHHQAAPLLDEQSSYLGLIGVASLGWLGWTAVAAAVRRRQDAVPMEAWQVLWIVIMFATGGLNSILGALGITMFRASCRYSIVILAIALLWAARRLSEIQAARTRPGDAAGVAGSGGHELVWLVAPFICSLVVLRDQVPRPPARELQAHVAQLVAADREFTAKIEAALPVGAMVFQLPVMEYPEAPAPGIPPYDHFRPYLFSRQLRYSFGAIKGRERDRWQLELAAIEPSRAVAEMRRRGFAAVLLNRNGFPERGRKIEELLRGLDGVGPAIESATGDLVCIPLGAGGPKPGD
jgi:phosphoglycerol transferase